MNTDMTRIYNELQRRDIQSMSSDNEIPLTFSQQFNWNRSMSIKWDPTTNLRMSLNTGTNAEVEEPFLPVNKERYPSEYLAWKDSVKHSIESFGNPLSYQQNFNASYTLPLNKMPIFEWLTADASYTGSYNWMRGNSISGVSVGNNIANKRNITLKTSMNFEKLYNLVPYLEETNKRFASNSKKQKSAKSRKPKIEKAKPFTKEIKLKTDTTTTITHNLKNKKLDVIARTKKGEAYKLKYKVIDENKILIKNLDSVSVKITITAKQKNGERYAIPDTRAYDIAQCIVQLHQCLCYEPARLYAECRRHFRTAYDERPLRSRP